MLLLVEKTVSGKDYGCSAINVKSVKLAWLIARLQSHSVSHFCHGLGLRGIVPHDFSHLKISSF